MNFLEQIKVRRLTFIIFSKCQPRFVLSMSLNFCQISGLCYNEIALIKQSAFTFFLNSKDNVSTRWWIQALRHGCSPINLLHIFRTPFYKNSSGGRLWIGSHMHLQINDKMEVKIKKWCSKHWLRYSFNLSIFSGLFHNILQFWCNYIFTIKRKVNKKVWRWYQKFLKN